MTTSNNHKTPPSRRPVKEWYTLDELARAWTAEFHAEFTRDYLMELASRPGYILTIGVIASNWHFYRYDQNSKKETPDYELLNGFVDLGMHTIKELIEAESTKVDWIRLCHGSRECFVCTLDSQKSDKPCGRKYQDLIIDDGEKMYQPLIHRRDLKVSNEERIRYERLLRGQHDSASDSSPVVDTETYGETEANSEVRGQEANTHSSKFTFAESELTLEPLDPSPAEADHLSNSDSDSRIRASDGRDDLQSQPAQSITDELAKEKAAQNTSRAEAWKLRAKEIAHELDPEHITPNLSNLASDILKKLNDEKLMNRNNKPPSIESIKRDILRGWKSRT
jgi:hypothetical protein